MAIFLIKVPFEPVGFDFETASTKARMFCESCSAENDALPTPAWMMPAFSMRN
jgi:hypothetical protein